MKEKTLKLAQEWGLDEVTITQGMNGYPEGLCGALIGFDYFEDAECFAEEVGGEVVLLTKRDGHSFWKCHGRAFDGIEMAVYIDEEHYEVFKDEDNFEYWACQEIAFKIEMGDNIFDLKNALVEMCKTYDMISDRSGGQIAIVDKSDYTCELESEYVTTIHDNDVTTIHDNDVTTYAIAVIDGDSEKEIEEEED